MIFIYLQISSFTRSTNTAPATALSSYRPVLLWTVLLLIIIRWWWWWSILRTILGSILLLLLRSVLLLLSLFSTVIMICHRCCFFFTKNTVIPIFVTAPKTAGIAIPAASARPAPPPDCFFVPR